MNNCKYNRYVGMLARFSNYNPNRSVGTYFKEQFTPAIATSQPYGFCTYFLANATRHS